jgi:hypothetical protein
MRHFIFGYGSLICPLSRAVTAPSLKDAIAEPAVISHIERTWSARVSKCQVRQQARQQQRRQHHHSNDDDDDSVRDNNDDNRGDVCDDDDDDDDTMMMIRGWTPMGVRFRRGAECNGVLIRVDDAELSRFDAREAGYLRRRIDLADVRPHVDDDDDADDDDYAMEGGEGGEGVRRRVVSSSSSPPPLADAGCAECRRVFEMARAKRRRRRAGAAKTETSSPPREWNDVAVWVYVQRER